MGDAAPSVFPEIRPLAFFLPQFHPTRDNDTFWGGVGSVLAGYGGGSGCSFGAGC